MRNITIKIHICFVHIKPRPRVYRQVFEINKPVCELNAIRVANPNKEINGTAGNKTFVF